MIWTWWLAQTGFAQYNFDLLKDLREVMLARVWNFKTALLGVFGYVWLFLFFFSIICHSTCVSWSFCIITYYLQHHIHVPCYPVSVVINILEGGGWPLDVRMTFHRQGGRLGTHGHPGVVHNFVPFLIRALYLGASKDFVYPVYPVVLPLCPPCPVDFIFRKTYNIFQ